VVIARGDIWWAVLPAPVGSGPGYRRPVVVVQSDLFNRSRIGTIIVAALTSNLRLAAAPGNVRLSKRTSGLPRESVVNVSQLFTLDRGRLREKVGALVSAKMLEIDRGVRLALEL
jgi:mRNA interferase MazF